MASVNPLLNGMTSDKTVRDYKHASKTFVDNNYELQPKYSNLFHVVFEFTPDAATLFDTIQQLEIPILVKSADLPSYTLDVQTHNQYNRKTQSHHSFQYQPVTIRFHDDAKENIRNLWHKYYIYYNADPTYDLDGNSYTTSDKYANRTQQQWGLQRGNKRFFKNIKIYSMHNHKFGEYTLVNPIITAFSHDQHAYANGGLMENTMQIAYETVKYATGFVNNITPRGFGDIHYDVEVSDLSADNLAIGEDNAFIDGSIRTTTGERPKDLFQGNVIGTITDAEIIFNQTKPNGGSLISDTISIFANNLLTGKNPTSNILVPITGAADRFTQDFTGNVTDGIINYFRGENTSSQTPNNSDKTPSNGIVFSLGEMIQTTKNNIVKDVPFLKGFATQVPNPGTQAVANKISDTRTTGTKSSAVQKPFNQIDAGT